jgi:squalene cyclase
MALGTRVQFEQSGASRSSGVLTALSERLSEAIDRGVNYLLSLQASEGYWMGELEADTTLESD